MGTRGTPGRENDGERQGRATVGGYRRNDGSARDPSSPTLKQIAIDKHLGDRARKLYGLTEKQFRLFVLDGRTDVERCIERTTFRDMSTKPAIWQLLCLCHARGIVNGKGDRAAHGRKGFFEKPFTDVAPIWD